MQKKLYLILNNWPTCYITSSDINHSLNVSIDAFRSLVKRAVKEGVLIRLKRNFYLIQNKIEQQKADPYLLAALLYGPSYISLESALSYHGWIPESVPLICSASSKRSVQLETPFGAFAYYKIPTGIFSVGINSHKNDHANFFIADPWKAIADLIYIKKKDWKNVFFLSQDMRIELDTLQNSNVDLLEKLSQDYPNQQVRKILKIMAKDLLQ